MQENYSSDVAGGVEERKDVDVEEGVCGEARVFLSYKDNESSSDGTNSNNKTPLPSRAPQTRAGNQEIDIDQLIAKLLEIPNEELLVSFLNLS
jgi:hypothetical protein